MTIIRIETCTKVYHLVNPVIQRIFQKCCERWGFLFQTPTSGPWAPHGDRLWKFDFAIEGVPDFCPTPLCTAYMIVFLFKLGHIIDVMMSYTLRSTYLLGMNQNIKP